MIMALIEGGVRQPMRQHFSRRPDPVLNECLTTIPSSQDASINQSRKSSQAPPGEPMCQAPAGMDPAPLSVYQASGNVLDEERENSDGWIKIDWPLGGAMNPGGDRMDRSPNRTRESGEPQGGWQEYRNLYNFKPPVQVSKLSVNLQDSGNRPRSPQPPPPNQTHTSPTRTYGGGNRTPSTPDSPGLDTSILLPGISTPTVDRTPSPLQNPFFPTIDPQALRASHSNGRSSPRVFPPASVAASHHPRSRLNETPSTPPTSQYNSHFAGVSPTPAVGQPVVVSSHPVPPHQPNTSQGQQDVRRKTSGSHQPDPARWADPYPPKQGGGVYHAAGPSPVGHGSNTQAASLPPFHSSPPKQRPSPQGVDRPEFRHSKSSQEEAAYNQALIMHQNARKDRLRRDLEEEKAKLGKMRTEIAEMETDLGSKRAHRTHFIPPEQISQLREEKRQLQIDIECMNKEIEMFRKQGITYIDKPHQENFYAGIMSGPNGPIPTHGPAPAAVQPIVLDPDEGQQWSCTHCTFLNHPFLDKCECCEMPRDSP